jgi:hypothetical protein
MMSFWCFMSMYRTAKQRSCPKAAPLGTDSKNRVTVDLTLTSIMMIPGPMIDNGAGAADATTPIGHTGTYHLNAIGLDQFGNPTPTQPTFTYTVASGPGTIAGSVLTPSSSSGTIEVTASATLSGATATSASSGFNIVSGSGPTSTPSDPVAVIARAEDGTDADIGWAPVTGSPSGFLIEASTDGGTTWTPLGISGASTTQYLATNLIGNDTYDFEVIPFNAKGEATAVNDETYTPNITIGSASSAGYYRVSFNDPANPGATSEYFTPNSEQDADVGSLALPRSGPTWIYADSAADAARQVLTGSYVDSSTGGTTYTYAKSGAFIYSPDFIAADRMNVGPAIVVEDRYNVTPDAHDYNDAYVALTVKTEAVNVQATPDTDYYSVPDASYLVGLFHCTDQTSTSSQFSATVTWSDATTSTGTIWDEGMGYFAVSTETAPTEDQASRYTLSISQVPTGPTVSDTYGGSDSVIGGHGVAPAGG